ncbi:MAG TPA: CmcJ/NvfI family oxidoreductase [Kofleriaceae bacterium]|nr:CmcJ/NvfI family oxidoreductase [Kofleriaceae bacterium]
MSTPIAPADITAQLTYSVDTGVKPLNESYGPGNVLTRNVGETEVRAVRIRDGRPLAGQFALERNGFVLVEHATRVADFFDRPRIPEVYYPEVAELVKRVSGARRVLAFDHTVRSGDDRAREARRVQEPVMLVHNDYTEWSGPQRVRDVLPDEADALLQHRFAIIQVWRPIHRSVQRNPLGLVDARTVAPGDLIASERRYPDRVGEVYRVGYNPAHAWFYFPQMRPGEAIVFKVYDSEKDGRARFTAHTAFHDPTTPPDAPPRESIEARAFAFFGPG